MFIAQLKVKRDAKTYTYHRLMESVRTPKGPRQRLIMSLGTLSIPKAQWPVLAERIQDFLTHQRVIPLRLHRRWTTWPSDMLSAYATSSCVNLREPSPGDRPSRSM